MLEIHGLSVGYGEVEILRDVSWRLMGAGLVN